MRLVAATRVLLCLLTLPYLATAFLLSPTITSSRATHTRSLQSSRSRCSFLLAVSKKRDTLIDGAEWGSLKANLNVVGAASSRCGRMTVVTGTRLDDSNERVVGIEVNEESSNNNNNNNNSSNMATVALSSECSIYQDSMATIPRGIKDDKAITTLVASLAPIHCALPKATGIGGSESDFVDTSGRVIVVGGSEYASFVARGLAAMGTSVSIVSTGNPKIDDYRVESLDPAVGDLEVAFCSHVGEFDSLVDTISDEANLAETAINDSDGFAFDRSSMPGGVLSLLKSRHKCSRYVSTMTASQRIVRDGGVIFGPGQAKDHVKTISNMNNGATPYIIPPKGFGTTVETLLKDGITYSWTYDGNTMVRSWSLPEFWELTSWPRDSAGGSNIRFGFPVVDDLDMMADEDDGDYDDDEEEEEENQVEGAKGSNPFITEIDGVTALSREILKKDDQNCVLFLSATYCRTCKTIAPAYSRFARLNQSDGVLFAKADTSGAAGKELGRTLEVNAVPLFVFFRNGQRFGTPLTINKLPSKKLDLALSFLTTGSKWDNAALDEVKEQNEGRRRK